MRTKNLIKYDNNYETNQIKKSNGKSLKHDKK